MASAKLKPIYERLNGINNYHPYSANTFADWSVEAGDIVTLKRGEEAYASPTHSVSMNWNGQSKVVLESKGEKTRGSVAVMSAKSYTSGGGGGNSYRSSRSGGRRTQQDLAAVEDGLNDVLIYAQDVDGRLSGRVDVQAGKVSLVVEEKNGQNVIKAASITAAINDSGESSVAINADKIKLDGTTTLNNVMTVSGGSVHISKPLLVDGAYADFNEIRVHNTRFAINGNNADYVIVGANVSGNVLTLTRANGDTIPFSKATTQTGAWSGNITAGKSYKVTAKQNNVVVNTHYSPALDGYYTGTKSWEDNYHTLSLPVTVYDENGTDLFRDTLSIDTSAAYSAGASSSSYSYSRTITYNRTEELPSGTLRYHYYTTGEYIVTSGTKTVHYN